MGRPARNCLVAAATMSRRPLGSMSSSVTALTPSLVPSAAASDRHAADLVVAGQDESALSSPHEHHNVALPRIC